MEEDPLLNYGNHVALELWEMTWEQLIMTPSRLTAEPVNRAERESMLEQARTRGYLDTYRGVRITSTGRRFLVENALIWNVVDGKGQRVGQAATFSQWTWLTSRMLKKSSFSSSDPVRATAPPPPSPAFYYCKTYR